MTDFGIPPEQHRAIFGETLNPLARALRDYVVAASDRPTLASADSPAMAEIAAEHRFAQPDWSAPATNAHTYGFMLTGLLLDHLDAFAALRWSAGGPVYAHATLLRVAMEVAPVAGWLLEPRIGAERRIKRSIVYRIESANQLGKQELPNAAAGSEWARSSAIAFAEANRWPVENLKDGGRKAIGGERSPLVRDGAFLELWQPPTTDAKELRERADTDAAMWRFASAVAHGTAYAIVEALHEPPPSASIRGGGQIDPTMIQRGFTASTERVTSFGLMFAMAMDEVVNRRDALMGWTAPPAQIDAVARLTKINKELVHRMKARTS